MRTFYRNCNGKASCNCAAAIRVGDDVIVFDKCGASASSKKDTPIDIRLILNGELTPGTKIFRHGGGKKYKVGLQD